MHEGVIPYTTIVPPANIWLSGVSDGWDKLPNLIPVAGPISRTLPKNAPVRVRICARLSCEVIIRKIKRKKKRKRRGRKRPAVRDRSNLPVGNFQAIRSYGRSESFRNIVQHRKILIVSSAPSIDKWARGAKCSIHLVHADVPMRNIQIRVDRHCNGSRSFIRTSEIREVFAIYGSLFASVSDCE